MVHVVDDNTVVDSTLSPSHSQSVFIDRVSCVHYDLADLIVTVSLLYYGFIWPIPLNSCGWSSLSETDDSELRRTHIWLSV